MENKISIFLSDSNRNYQLLVLLLGCQTIVEAPLDNDFSIVFSIINLGLS